MNNQGRRGKVGVDLTSGWWSVQSVKESTRSMSLEIDQVRDQLNLWGSLTKESTGAARLWLDIIDKEESDEEYSMGRSMTIFWSSRKIHMRREEIQRNWLIRFADSKLRWAGDWSMLTDYYSLTNGNGSEISERNEQIGGVQESIKSLWWLYL